MTYYFLIGFVLAGLAVRFVGGLRGIILAKSLQWKSKATFSTISHAVFYEGFLKMKYCMISLSMNFKIINRIIKFISVFVMNNFKRMWKEFSANMSLHYNSMFSYLFTINTNKFITKLVNTTLSIGVAFSHVRVFVFFPSFIMNHTKTSCFMFSSTFRNITNSHNLILPQDVVSCQGGLLSLV